MQRAEDSSSRLAPEPASPRSGLKPTTAFLLLLLLITTVGALVFLTRPDAAPTPPTTNKATEPNFALTNEQAIARLRELDDLRHEAFRQTDESLLTSIYAPSTEVLEIARKEIGQLRGDRVSDASAFTTLSLDVISNESDSIRLRQVVEVRPKFIARDGSDVTDAGELIKRTVVWTLSEIDGEWLVGNIVITKAKVVRG